MVPRVSASLIILTGFILTSATAQTRITGRTVDSTGAPVFLIMVSCGDESVLTESDGRFEVVVRSPEDTIVSFRRAGFHPVEAVVVPATPDSSVVDLGDIEMSVAPFALDEISVEGERPVLTARAVRDIETRRRVGGAYIFTAEDIERIRPAQLSQLAYRVPRGSRGEDGYGGTVVRFQNRNTLRGPYCTARVIVDGWNTGSADLDFLVSPERVGGIIFDPKGCSVSVWTKPISPEDASPFEIAGHIGSRLDGGGFLGSYLGMHLVTPVRRGHGTVRLRLGLSARLGGTAEKWRAIANLTVRPFGHGSPLYAGMGAGLSKGGAAVHTDSRDPVSAHHTVVSGLSFDLFRFRPFLELQVFDPLQPSRAFVSSHLGVGFRIGG